MGRIISEVDQGSRVVAGVDTASARCSGTTVAAVSKSNSVDTGEDLTEDECFDTMPTDDQITERLAHRQPERWICRGRGTQFDARTDGDLIVDHVQVCDLVAGAGNLIRGAP